MWPECPAYPWATGVDDGGLPDGEPFVTSTRAGSRAPGEAHEYHFHMCESATVCNNCVDDSFYPNTSFASEFGWIGMPSLESLAPVLGQSITHSITSRRFKGFFQEGATNRDLRCVLHRNTLSTLWCWVQTTSRIRNKGIQPHLMYD